MLLRYIVSNFKSIGHTVEFSMLPPENLSDTESQLLQSITVGTTQWQVLQKGVLLGANGDGKTNLLQSLNFARNFVVKPQESGTGTGISLVQFRAPLQDSQGRSSFQFVLYAGGQVYDYGFSLDESQVHEEWLMQVHEDGVKSSPLFVRLTDAEGQTKIEVNPQLVNDAPEDLALVNLLTRSMQADQKNQLFLYRLFDHGIKTAKTVVDWFKRMQFIFPETEVLVLPLPSQDGVAIREFLAQMLSRMEIGVTQVAAASTEIDLSDLAKALSLPQQAVSDMVIAQSGILVHQGKGKCYIFVRRERTTKLMQLKFVHRLANQDVPFYFEEESRSTQRLVQLLPMLFGAADSDKMYFVDELERCLHPKLVTFLIEEFVHQAKHSQSQLVFTTHDVHLLSGHSDVLCREEFWLMDKSQQGESTLTSLAAYKHREGQDDLKAYINGRFGAVPF